MQGVGYRKFCYVICRWTCRWTSFVHCVYIHFDSLYTDTRTPI